MFKRPRIDDGSTYNIDKKLKPMVCDHPCFLSELCISCGQHADDGTDLFRAFVASVPLDYINKGMRLSKDTLAHMKSEDTKDLLGQRKLFLVLDLDHTLLHSIQLHDKNPDDVRCLIDQAENSQNCDFFHVTSFSMVTKLRPFVRTFLEEANSMFKMYISTRGKRRYAHKMVGLLDPEGVYFGSRVIAKEDATRPPQKGLDVVLGLESAVLIVDDQVKVWENHIANLIRVDGYNYSPEKCGDENDKTLEVVLQILKNVHTDFFTEFDREKSNETDARKVLQMIIHDTNTK